MSDCDDAPSANIACFFAVARRVFEARADFGNDVGALRSGIDRYDDDTCDGENPLTTLVTLRSDVEVTESAAADCGELSDDSVLLGGTVGAGAFDVAMAGAVCSCEALLVGFASDFLASGARYECVLMPNGSRSFFSLIVITIFSKSSGVICRSLPRLLLQAESCRCTLGLVMLRGADVEALSSLSDSMASSSARESRLPDSSGTSEVYRPSELLCEIDIAGVVALASPGAQQNVSLFHNLQLKFSSRRPSSIDPAHLLNTVHILKRFSTFLVSIWCIVFASTVKTGVAKEEGMADWLDRRADARVKTRSLTKIANSLATLRR